MPVQHKFLNHNWDNGFRTENAILKTDLYKPEVLFLGTFNHGFLWNSSDFFYGRDMYMWTIMANLFLYNENHLFSRRTCNNNIPTLDQIFKICEKGKLAFADLIKGTSENVDISVNIINKSVTIDNQYVWNNYKDNSIIDLMNLGLIDNNVDEIIRYVNENKSLKYIYCTFKSGNNFIEMVNNIRKGIRDNVEIGHIFSPTANGFRENLEFPFNERAWSLAHCWLWNGNPHNEILINRPDYIHLNHQWLQNCGVFINNF